jgi:hypothetical protein
MSSARQHANGTIDDRIVLWSFPFTDGATSAGGDGRITCSAVMPPAVN